MLTDHQHPIFSGMIVEWLNGHQPEEASGLLTRLGVEDDMQQNYFSHMRNEDVTVGLGTPHQVIDITPTMAINAPKVLPALKINGLNVHQF